MTINNIYLLTFNFKKINIFKRTWINPFFAVRLECCISEFSKLDSRDQFHQHSTSSFYAQISQKRTKNSQVKLLFALLWFARVKAARRMLVKLTPGFTFLILSKGFAIVIIILNLTITKKYKRDLNQNF